VGEIVLPLCMSRLFGRRSSLGRNRLRAPSCCWGLTVVFFGPTKLLPIAFALGTLHALVWQPTALSATVGEP
jgi:hypothetical protein